MALRPGNIYALSREEDPRGDPKPGRPHLLLSLPDAAVELATLAFCSTKDTEANFGAPHVIINRKNPILEWMRLLEPTYVYVSRLVTEEPNRLGPSMAGVHDEMHRVRAALRTAIGLGTGTANGAGAARDTLRGRILRLGPVVEGQLGTPYALAITGPGYVRKLRYQNVVPLYEADEYDHAGVDFVAENCEWVKRLGMSERVLLSINAVCSCFYPDRNHVRGLQGTVVDEQTMVDVDRALTSRFGLAIGARAQAEAGN